MSLFCRLAVVACVSVLSRLPALASNLVTGNGFGFAVLSPATARVTKFYAHPYSFGPPDPNHPLSEGIETVNFLHGLAWADGAELNAATEYQEDSQVIRTRTSQGNGVAFMPFGLTRAALIVSWEPSAKDHHSSGWQVDWSHPVQAAREVHISGLDMQQLRFEGVQESLLLIPLGRSWGPSQRAHQGLATNLAWALISLEQESDLDATVRDFVRWRADLPPQGLVKRELAEVEHWRVHPAIDFNGEKERHLWRQSEIMLRIAQSREPNRPGRNNNGLIVAALPDGVFFTPWVRDMAYATVALARMGHRDEARAALLAYFNAQPTGKMRQQTADADYQISVVRYFGDGSEEPFFTMEGSTNIEFDDWGLALWVLGEYLRKYDDPALLATHTYRGRLYDSARDFVVKPLLANLEEYGGGLIVAADTSIWEERQKDKKHFAFSTAMAIVGLRNFAEIARREHDAPARTEVLKKIDLLQKGFSAAFFREGQLHGTLEPGIKNEIDGALLSIINFGVVTDPSIIRNTVERMELLRVASGGYRRVRGIFTDPSIYEYWYEQEEFLFVDFSLAEVDRRLGRDAEGAAMLKRIVDKASEDHNILPEMYVAVPCQLFPGKIGDPTGALPMVGYGAGVYILQMLQQNQLETSF